MSSLNLLRSARSILARRRSRFLDQLSFCDGCSRVDRDQDRRRSFGAHLTYAPHRLG